MSKRKIDFFNKNNKNSSKTDSMSKKTSASKTKPDIQKRRATSAKKILDATEIADNPAKEKRINKKTSGSKKINPPKRRGRRPKKILENATDIIESPKKTKEDSAVILRINIDPSKLKSIPAVKKSKKNNKKITPRENNDNEETSEGMFKNDIPGDNTCSKCAKNEKTLAMLKTKLEKYEKKEKIVQSNKIYKNNLSCIHYKTGKKIAIVSTNVKCWWDCHEFTNLPCFLPEFYHKDKYYVRGCFCSFNCALAYNLYYLKDSKIHQRKSLIYRLYRELYGMTFEDIVDIKEAPLRELLEDFGGTMSITTFRRRFYTTNKEYIVYIPPIKPMNLIIEERNVEVHDTDDKKYVLKRTKPLSKKRSVISSMMEKFEDEE